MKIVTMGDSTTQGYPFTTQESWVEYLAQGLKCQVINQGVCGDFTSGMSERFQRDVLDHAPSHAIILGGANDAYEKINLESVCSNFITMVGLCKEHDISPILGLPTPSLLPEEEQLLTKYRRWIKSYTNEKGILLIDFYSAFSNRISAGQRYQLFVDEVHPSIEGYKLMGEVAIQSLRSLMY
ncbi:MAG TPA: GDSL-type esterase/lipase family protein [Desulfosporosinus sp.]|nr:GDSL-type esterase/lipase family protein [Desulfosporosinus sp.]